MKKTVLINENIDYITSLNEIIFQYEKKGYEVISTQFVAGNSFHKYTSKAEILVTMQKTV